MNTMRNILQINQNIVMPRAFLPKAWAPLLLALPIRLTDHWSKEAKISLASTMNIPKQEPLSSVLWSLYTSWSASPSTLIFLYPKSLQNMIAYSIAYDSSSSGLGNNSLLILTVARTTPSQSQMRALIPTLLLALSTVAS